MNFDDPKLVTEKRKQQIIFILPSLKGRIDSARIKSRMSRSEWIERAILRELRADAEEKEGA